MSDWHAFELLLLWTLLCWDRDIPGLYHQVSVGNWSDGTWTMF